MSRMFRLNLVGPLMMLALLAAAPLLAQVNGANVAHCRVWEPHPDNPFDYAHSFTQPALAWDVEYATASAATFYALKSVGVPPIVAALIPAVDFGLLPHVLGHAQGRYPISLHWAFVAADRALPIALAVHDSSRTTALTAWAVVTTGLVCFDR